MQNVYKVCDSPHPAVIKKILEACAKGDIDTSCGLMQELHREGYASVDLISTVINVYKSDKTMPEALKLSFIKEIGVTHLRVVEGVGSLLQLSGMLARLCALSA